MTSDDLIDYSKMLPWGRTPFCQEGWESPTKYRVSHIVYRRISTPGTSGTSGTPQTSLVSRVSHGWEFPTRYRVSHIGPGRPGHPRRPWYPECPTCPRDTRQGFCQACLARVPRHTCLFPLGW